MNCVSLCEDRVNFVSLCEGGVNLAVYVRVG